MDTSLLIQKREQILKRCKLHKKDSSSFHLAMEDLKKNREALANNGFYWIPEHLTFDHRIK